MGELAGVLAAVASSALGGTAVAATRYVVGSTDPLTLGAFRFGLGFLFLLPVAVLQRSRWPGRADWPAVAGLGLLFFGLFPLLFNSALAFTTAARGALALSTLPLLTMAVAAALGVEPLGRRKTAGVLLAMGGVAAALVGGLDEAPAGAWRGDLLMIAAALCMAVYNVGSKPFIRRSAPLTFTVAGMGVGAAVLGTIALARGGFAAASGFGPGEWVAIGYLGLFGSAAAFLLWGFALAHASPTRVAVGVTVNPITASLLAVLLLDEPIRWPLVAGIAAVIAGITLTGTGNRRTG